MDDTDHEGDDTAAAKRRGDDEDIRQVAVADPRIVGYQYVTGFERIGGVIVGEDLFERGVKRTDM